MSSKNFALSYVGDDETFFAHIFGRKIRVLHAHGVIGSMQGWIMSLVIYSLLCSRVPVQEAFLDAYMQDIAGPMMRRISYLNHDSVRLDFADGFSDKICAELGDVGGSNEVYASTWNQQGHIHF
jgi:hypothetical protein